MAPPPPPATAAPTATQEASAALPPRPASQAAPEGRRAWTGRAVRLAAWAGLAVVLGWVGLTRWLPGGPTADTLTATAARGDLVITVVDRGELESSKSVPVVCEVEGGGKLAMIVPEGTQVKKDEVVARLDTDALLKAINEQEVKWQQAEGRMKAARSELEVQKNKAESEVAKAELALTLAGIDYEAYLEGEYQVELDKRKGTLELGKKDLKEAEDSLEFTRGLVRKGFAQLEQVRVMELAVEGKRYTVRQQEADLRVFEKFTRLRKVTELKAKAEDARRELERTIKSQAAATEKAETELGAAEKTAGLEKRHLERLRGQLEKCVIRAPQDGIVIYYQRPWDDMSRIRVGVPLDYQQPIFTLPDLNNMRVSLRVHESVVKKVRAGQPATLQADALPNRVLRGKVLTVATLAQNDGWRGGGVKEYRTEVSIDDLPTGAGLRPGMTAEVKILVETVRDAVTVPIQAVTEFDGKHICYVQTPAGLERRAVRVGESNQQLIQILDGVAPGERVALDARVRAIAELKTGKERPGENNEPNPQDGTSTPSPGR